MLLADPRIQRPFFEPRVASATQVMAAIDPLVTIGVLLLCAALFHVRFAGAYLILALVVFSLTFPGGAPHASSAGALARDVLTSWSMTVAVLLFIGWATSTTETLDQRVLLAWLLATPVARFATHLAIPRLLRRLFTAAGVQRVAVIAGACGLGRTLAEQIRSNPLLGIRVAGFFDDRGPARTGDATAGSGAIPGAPDQPAAFVQTHPGDLYFITLPMGTS